MSRSVVIVPSRGRKDRFNLCMDHLIARTKSSDIIVALDEDEHEGYTRYENVEYVIGPKPVKLGVNEKLNRVANSVKDKYDYILWIADDTVVQTDGWDDLLVFAIKDIRNGISYPNDLLRRDALPSNGTCFDANIVRSLGYLAPPALLHLYIDNFWKRLGDTLKTLRYCPNVVVDHQHYTNGKAEKDFIYGEVNAEWMYEHDKAQLALYYANGFSQDLERLMNK